MAYETKVILSAIAAIMRLTDDMDVAYGELCEIANTEGVILKPRRKADVEKPEGQS